MEEKGEGKDGRYVDEKGEANDGRDVEEDDRDVEEEGNALSTAEMMERACDFYYNDEELEETLHRWASAHCDGFAEQGTGEDGDGEFALEHTELHAQFVELLEQQLEAFVEGDMGVSVPDFFAAVEADAHSSAAARSAFSGCTFARLVNAAADFQRFCEMMCDAKLGCFAWGMPPLEDGETGKLII